jgi:hypothetical protein
MPRLAAICALALAACDPTPVPGGATDASVPDAFDDPDVPRDGSIDAPVDPPLDAPPADLTPPSPLAIVPADESEIWLHEPVRVEFDEPIAIVAASATATIDGRAVNVTLELHGDRELVIAIDGAARGVGTLSLSLWAVEDLAGNAAAPLELAYSVAPWHRPAVDRGLATTSPAVAVTSRGGVIAAWTVGAPGARRVVASEHTWGAWRPLGGALGANDATSVTLALDANDHPVVGWLEAGATRFARWDGGWSELPSLGAGSRLALAAPADGGAVVALVVGGGDAAIYRLDAGTWLPIATRPLEGAIVGEPAIAAPTNTAVAVAWIAGGAIRVHRHAGSWTALAPLTANTEHVALAAHKSTLVVAWDQVAGSSGVYAARADGAGWVRLGRALDVDVAGDASAPAIALDGTTPIIAWRERIETAERGVVARWSSGAWRIVGGHSFLPTASPRPTPPALALSGGGAPVVGWSTTGAIRIARFNGPRTPAAGLAARPPLAGCAFSTSPPPRLLQTGCFTLAAAGKPAPHPGLVPYDVVVELWSDGTKKRRWLVPPDNTKLTATATGAWTGPPGTFLVKEFAIETTPGDPATRRAIETRLLLRTETGWDGFTYRWRSDGSDADLLGDGVSTFDWPITGGTYRHVYPSRTQCRSCHHVSYGPLLGVRATQLARWFDYGGVIADQLATLSAIGVGPGATGEPLESPHDASASLATRVRGYFAANCAHCHNPGHVAIKDLRPTTPLAQTRLCEVISPGQPAQSRLYQLVSSRPGMPALATLVPDPLATDLVGRWITQLTSCP